MQSKCCIRITAPIKTMAKKNDIGNLEITNCDLKQAGTEPATTAGQLIVTQTSIESCILTMRGQQVMLDRDLAMLYGVETRRLNEQVKRNADRFPEDFMFQLSQEEFENWKSQNATSNSILMGARKRPYAFTENGVAMLSGVLHSPTAVEVNIRIMRAFTAMRRFLVSNAEVFQRLETIEYHQLETSLQLKQYKTETDKKMEELFKRLDAGAGQPKQGIFFDGQMYDAYEFVSGLVKQAKSEIVLIDNYVDETVLTLLDKRASGVKTTIYTDHIGSQLQLDITRHNSQYAPIDVLVYRRSHDRFLCIDEKVYHFGASIKDLGKKWFAFSLLEDTHPTELVNKINGMA